MKKRWILAVIIFVLLISSFVFVFLRNSPVSKQEKQTETNTTTPSLGEISPGSSTSSDLIRELGEPLEKETLQMGAIYKYPSNSEVRTNDYLVKENKISLIKEVITNKKERTIDEIRQKYGVAGNVLYGADSNSGFNLYIIPERGISYLANLNTDTLMEVWYFEPTTYEEFKKTFGQDYSETTPVIQ